jgi:hypothetical protein
VQIASDHTWAAVSVLKKGMFSKDRPPAVAVLVGGGSSGRGNDFPCRRIHRAGLADVQLNLSAPSYTSLGAELAARQKPCHPALAGMIEGL